MNTKLLILFLSVVNLWSPVPVHAQDSLIYRPLTLDEVYKLTTANSYRLKITARNVESAKQRVEIVRSEKLPSLLSDLSYGYISNADTWSPSFTNHRTSQIPHQFTAFSILASQVVFKGGELQNDLKKSTLEEQIARLSFEKNTQDVKLLVTAKYLDIYRMSSQKKIYQNNIKLTQNRLKNVLTMQKQGMVTKNDVLRTELIISDFQLALRRINDDILILNKQLNIIAGLPDSEILVPDSLLLTEVHPGRSLIEYLNFADRSNQDLKIAGINNQVAAYNVKLSGSDRFPQVSIYTRTNLQRPFTSVVPAVDIYSNVWQAGVGVHYNISSIYQARKRIRMTETALAQAQDMEILDQQNVHVAISAAYIKYSEANEDLTTLNTDLKSAEENYRVVEKKYFNQLALLTDMIDATNIKIEAELKVVNARINVVYTYRQLLHSVGIL